jgi:hypothetical protein
MQHTHHGSVGLGVQRRWGHGAHITVHSAPTFIHRVYGPKLIVVEATKVCPWTNVVENSTCMLQLRARHLLPCICSHASHHQLIPQCHALFLLQLHWFLPQSHALMEQFIGWQGLWPTTSLFVWLVADGWCWFVLREYCWLVADGWFVLREKYCRLLADKPN